MGAKTCAKSLIIVYLYDLYKKKKKNENILYGFGWRWIGIPLLRVRRFHVDIYNANEIFKV